MTFVVVVAGTLGTLAMFGAVALGFHVLRARSELARKEAARASFQATQDAILGDRLGELLVASASSRNRVPLSRVSQFSAMTGQHVELDAREEERRTQARARADARRKRRRAR